MKTVFEQIKELEIPFAVGLSYSKLKKQGNNNSPPYDYQDFFLMISEVDGDCTKPPKEIKEWPLKLDKDYSSNKVLTQELTQDEISEFRDIEDEFILVVEDEDGKIWELKNNSLKSYIKNLKQ